MQKDKEKFLAAVRQRWAQKNPFNRLTSSDQNVSGFDLFGNADGTLVVPRPRWRTFHPACGNRCRHRFHDSTAPLGLPGR